MIKINYAGTLYKRCSEIADSVTLLTRFPVKVENVWGDL